MDLVSVVIAIVSSYYHRVFGGFWIEITSQNHWN